MFLLQIAACIDIDGDGIPNIKDNCPVVTNEGQLDQDSDEVGDLCDNCPNNWNPRQSDADDDGRGDACWFDNTTCEKDVIDSWTSVCNPLGQSCGEGWKCCTYECISCPTPNKVDCYCVKIPAPEEVSHALMSCTKIDCVEN